MQKRRKYIRYLYAGLIFMGFFDLLIFLIDPSKPLLLFSFDVSPIPFFFIFLAGSTFFLGTYIFYNIRRGVFLSLYCSIIFLLRILQYKSILYSIVLLLIFVCIEVFIHHIHLEKKKEFPQKSSRLKRG